MKKIILIIFLSFPFILNAQTRIADKEKLETIQIAYLSRELNLTSAEAEKFWPVYNKYQEEMKAVLRKGKEEDVLDKQQQILDIRKKYKPDFSKILSPDRTNKLFEAEVKFREMVKRELQERRKLRNGG
jgi:hypothetical protein